MLLIPIVVCGLLGLVLLVIFFKHERGRERFIAPEEFKQANERILAHFRHVLLGRHTLNQVMGRGGHTSLPFVDAANVH